MLRTSRSLEGQTAVVTGGGTLVGRAIALALAARGVRIVVTGRDEKALGVTVGEIVHGGGKARHLAGDPSDASHLGAVVARAIEVFDRFDIAVVADAASAEAASRVLAARMAPPGCLVAALVEREDDGAARTFVRELARDVAAKGITCNAIALDPSAEEDGAEDAAELAVFLCSRAGARISGQVIAVGHEVRTRPRE
jgi:NAD(P)-dependent dehydrogenase (short-subunit alcohol dehydrogenase family)